MKWKRAHKNERRPSNAIYAGTGTKGDGECYVARFDCVPGKVNVNTNDRVTLNHCWSPGFLFSRDYGEVLTTNCNYRWEFIKENEKIPENALGPYKIDNSELCEWNIKYVWVAKRINGEPGRLTCTKKDYDYIEKKSKTGANTADYNINDIDIPRMKSINAHSSFFPERSGYILVIDEMNGLNGYHCLKDDIE